MLFAALLLLFAAEDWPEFRGPTGQGISTQKDLPLTWSEKENIRWKVPVPGRGWSSPAILGDRVWLTTAVEVPGGASPKARSLRALAFDKNSGKILADTEVFRLEDAGHQHAKNSYASPTPVLEGDRVYVHFGQLGTAALNARGEILWKTSFPYDPMHGTGGSPVLYKDLLILACDGVDVQFLVALDKNTGKIRWKMDRSGKGNMAFSTGLVIESGGKPQLVWPSAYRTFSYDPESGKELWSVSYGDGFSNVPRPVFAHGLVYLCTGFYKPELLAVRPDGTGDVTSSHVVWRMGRGIALTPSPIVVGDEIYNVSDNGILTCLDAKSGKVHYQERLEGNYSASPVFAGGRIYWLSEEGETTVIAPGPRLRKLAFNRVGEQTLASLAVSGPAIFLRSAGHLYRIEKPAN